jgi:hypothetical protein
LALLQAKYNEAGSGEVGGRRERDLEEGEGRTEEKRERI